MEPKCNYCSFFGDKPHCHNCKIINKSRAHTPQEIDCSLEELVEYINQNADISERFGVGDYKTIELYTGEKVKLIILDTDKDTLAEGNGEACMGLVSYWGGCTHRARYGLVKPEPSSDTSPCKYADGQS